ncbi:MAG TPA: prepilin peptidase [Roseiflexaceae bacterium]|nr:prepilin peptidase [Roseiflexaceae bacterium]
MDPIVIAVFVAGLLLGSVLNIVIIRLPREREMGGWPRCTRCRQPLSWWQVLPLVGWLAQAGRGRCCGQSLSLLFPLVELLAGVSLAVFYLYYGLSSVFVYLSFVTAVLLVTGAIDWLHRSIYTFVILGAALIALLASLALRPYHNFTNALAGALAAGFVFALFFVLARVLFPGKSAPFGLGDVYLGIFIGAAVGLTRLGPALFYGMLLAGLYSAAIIVARRMGRTGISEYISYGTFLCLGALGFLLFRGLLS